MLFLLAYAHVTALWSAAMGNPCGAGLVIAVVALALVVRHVLVCRGDSHDSELDEVWRVLGQERPARKTRARRGRRG